MQRTATQLIVEHSVRYLSSRRSRSNSYVAFIQANEAAAASTRREVST